MLYFTPYEVRFLKLIFLAKKDQILCKHIIFGTKFMDLKSLENSGGKSKAKVQSLENVENEFFSK